MMRRVRSCLIPLVALVTAGIAAPTRADDLAVRIDDAIREGIEAILRKTRDEDVITYHERNLNQPTVTIRGRVIANRDGAITVQKSDGKRITISRRLIVKWLHAGYVESEYAETAFGGPSALAALALLSAGADPNEPRLKRLIEALTLDTTRDAGTYVHSLRAGVWSLLLDRKLGAEAKRRYSRLLHQDAAWLVRAMSGGGAFDYGVDFETGDNSNTQFGNLGLWAASVGNVEIADRVWKTIADYWLAQQHPGGGWCYRGREMPTPSMTVAGCNSLYIVLDRFYAKADKPYVYFRGAAPNALARKKMAAIHQAIADGDRFLSLHPPDIRQNYGYELFGLERLGVASGRSHIGDVDWFRQHAETVARRTWGGEVVADSFALTFLAHGRAPVLFQKLQHGADDNDWNYYHRDLPVLTRYMSSTFERLYRWQRIPQDSSVADMQHAPFLCISGNKALTLPEDAFQRIREYVDRGGTVLLHADRRSKAFTRSAIDLFERMFADTDLRFRELDATHPLYTCHFGGTEKPWKRPVPFQALSDGPRILVLLSPVDIAGAWHQARLNQAELFQIMANVRVYCAPPYGELEGVIRRHRPEPALASFRGELSLKRWGYAGEWAAHRGVWSRQRENIERRTGLRIQAEETSKRLDAGPLSKVDVVYLTTRGASKLHKPDVEALTAYLKDGGLLLIDSADGQPSGNAAVRRLVDALPIGERGVLNAGHPIATGAFDGGQPLLDLQTTQDGISLRRENTPPPILTRTLNDRVVVLACPFDLAAGLEGHFVWKRVGYTPESTRRIVDNILLWRHHVKRGG